MLQELTTLTAAGHLATASMLFFLVFWVVVSVKVYRATPEELDAQARLVLEGDGAAETPLHNGTKA